MDRRVFVILLSSVALGSAAEKKVDTFVLEVSGLV
jgi:hypothetical protein